MRIQIIVDDKFGKQIQDKAEHLGLSVSSFSRCVLRDALKTHKFNKLDLSLMEEPEEITFDQFRNELK